MLCSFLQAISESVLFVLVIEQKLACFQSWTLSKRNKTVSSTFCDAKFSESFAW